MSDNETNKTNKAYAAFLQAKGWGSAYDELIGPNGLNSGPAKSTTDSTPQIQAAPRARQTLRLVKGS